MARAAAGDAPGITFTDAEVRTGLIAMIAVRDPKGVDQREPGGHGSAFDRVGAFQVGFSEGAARCAELIDAPLPLVPNMFRPGDFSDGNSPFGYDEANGEIVPVVVNDLNAYWPQLLGADSITLAQLVVVPVQSADEIDCADPAGDFAGGAVYCAATQPGVLRRTAGPVTSTPASATSSSATCSAGRGARPCSSPSAARWRARRGALVDDCLTGAWVSTIIPDANGRPTRPTAVQPGDLDEAIQTALVVGDPTSTDDVLGSGFEKIASFRQGVLEGSTPAPPASATELPDRAPRRLVARSCRTATIRGLRRAGRPSA